MKDSINYFQAVNNPDDPFFTPDEDVTDLFDKYIPGEVQVMFDEINVPISYDEINTAIGQLSNGKSGRPDKILNECFVHGREVLLPALHILFNKVFENSYFPKDWTFGEIIPLHKKADKSNVQNYRGITLLSTLSKLFTRILNNRLTSWAEYYGMYIQKGSRL